MKREGLTEAAVVVHGHGRSGTTLLTSLLARHPDLGWLSQSSCLPVRPPQLAVLNRVRDVPGLNALLAGRRLEPVPQEAIDQWERWFPGFHDNHRDMTAADATEEGIAGFRALVRTTLRWHGKPRFLTKYTGYPRYSLVRAALPGCRIVRIDRDRRAVVASVVQQRWGYKRRPETWAALGPDGQVDRAVDRYLAWEEAVRAQATPADLVVSYEELVARPDEVLAALAADLGLRPDRRFPALRRGDVRDPGERWRTDLAPAQVRRLEARLATRA